MAYRSQVWSLKMNDHYKILQVDKKASPEVIKAAYHALCKLHSTEDSIMKKLNLAWEILGDQDKKKNWDDKQKPKGKIIGDYRLISQIAEGGFGTTYKAQHMTLGTNVCIKHALNISATDEELLLEEAKIIWDLRHWGIPAIRDILRMPDGSLSLVMSYVEGPTLYEVVEKNGSSLDPEHVAWICERILNIMYYLHLHGVIHGDIKPQNIIVQPQSHTVVLVDYGLSSLKPNRKTEAKGYTPYFAAPEQINGKTPIPETDLYSLGMTLIFALGGDVKNIKLPSNVPSHLFDFIKSLIKIEPLRRPPVWNKINLCETIKEVREADFGRKASGFKPLKF